MLTATYSAPRARVLSLLLVLATFSTPGCAVEGGKEGPLDPERAPVLGKADGWAAVHNLEQVRTFAVAAGDYSLLYGDDPDGAEVLLEPTAPTHAWVWSGSGWDYQGSLSEPTYLKVISPAWIALYPVGEGIELQTAYLGHPQLHIDRVFTSVVDGSTIALSGAVPGRPLYALVSGRGVAELSSVQATLTPVASPTGELAEPMTLEAEIVEFAGLLLEGEQRMVAMYLPESAPVGYGDLEISVDGFLAGGTPVELTSPSNAELRVELASTVEQYVIELAPEQVFSIVGGYNPLPKGAMIVDGLSGELVSAVKAERSFLFFAFDAEALFEQPEALWFLVNADTAEVEILEGRGGWPVVEVQGEPEPETLEPLNAVLLDYGSSSVLHNQFFMVGAGSVLLSTAPLYPTRNILAGAQVNKGKPISGNGDDDKCPTYRKIAIIVRLDDNTKASMRKESGGKKAIPNFDKVVRKEYGLLQAMGFDEIHYINPADLVSTSRYGRQFLELGKLGSTSVNHYGTKGLKPIIDRVAAAADSIKDCCGEVVVFINAHQDRQGYLIFSHHYKQKKRNRRERKKISASALAQRIARVFAEKKKTCVPTTVLFHSCYSGKFDGSRYNAPDNGAINIHKKLVVMASSAHDEKSRGKRKRRTRAEEFFFLEALDECMLIRNSAGKVIGLRTFKDAWACIEKKTNEKARAAGHPQKPRRKQNPALN